MSEDSGIKILGIEIGDSTGWDQWDTVVFSFHGFIPNQKCADAGMPEGDLTVDYDEGFIEITEEHQVEDEATEMAHPEAKSLWKKQGKEFVEFLLKVA